jgi:hypothetical protein
MEHKETLENRHYMVATVGYDPAVLCSDLHVTLSRSCPAVTLTITPTLPVLPPVGLLPWLSDILMCPLLGAACPSVIKKRSVTSDIPL